MAGNLGAIFHKNSSFFPFLSLYNRTSNRYISPSRKSPATLIHYQYHSQRFRNNNTNRALTTTMAEVEQQKVVETMEIEVEQQKVVETIEIEEPSPKIAKLHHNGADGTVAPPANLASVLRVKKLSENAVLPSRGSSFSAGYDLSSAVEIKVPARGKAMVPTDLSIGIPEGTYARVAPRSGLAHKHSIDVGAGVIDYDYRGPVGVILFNHSDVDFEVKAGDRIAQLILVKIATPDVKEVDELDVTVRGADGFGSTGV